MSMRWTPEQYQDYVRRQSLQMSQYHQVGDEADDGPESNLARKIAKYCKDKGYPCLNFRQSKKARGFLPPGWPDITLVTHNRVIFMELKAKGGRKSAEQVDTALMFQALGSLIHEVRSWKKFMEVVNGNQNQ